MQLITGKPMVVLVLVYVVHDGKKKRVWIFDVTNFEQFVAITLPKIELPGPNLAYS